MPNHLGWAPQAMTETFVMGTSLKRPQVAAEAVPKEHSFKIMEHRSICDLDYYRSSVM